MTKGQRVYLLLLSALCTWLCWREVWAQPLWSAEWCLWYGLSLFTMQPFYDPPAKRIIAWWDGRPKTSDERYFELKKRGEPR